MILILAILAAVFWIPSPWGWVVVGVAAIVETAEIWFWWWWGGKRRKTEVGVETFVGRRARVVTPCRPAGQVRLDGEIWEARCDAGAGIDDEVEVTAVDGLTFRVQLVE